jgi:SAM-dependent methyltransferase
MIVSRGVLVFLPDLAEALREVSRVLKPSGVAFLGGRYVYTPQAYKMTDERFQRVVEESGVLGAQFITDRGQWVKILGPQAPDAARQPAHGPQLLANRFLADYAIAEGDCLLLCQTDSESAQSLQRGFLETTNLKITALYVDEPQAAKARQRIGEARHESRITCAVGSLDHLPFPPGAFDAVIGVGPILLWGEREQRMAEIYRVLRDGGVALVGGRFLGMPEWRRVPSETLRASAAKTSIPSIRVLDDMGQWVEIRKGIGDRRFRD